MKVKTSELVGAPLHWAVAKSQDRLWYNTDGEFGAATGWLCNVAENSPALWVRLRDFLPSTDWAQGGPLVEKHLIKLTPLLKNFGDLVTWEAVIATAEAVVMSRGQTPLIAAMRAIVAAELGATVDVPDEIIRRQLERAEQC